MTMTNRERAIEVLANIDIYIDADRATKLLERFLEEAEQRGFVDGRKRGREEGKVLKDADFEDSPVSQEGFFPDDWRSGH